jgi:hypothetical protein
MSFWERYGSIGAGVVAAAGWGCLHYKRELKAVRGTEPGRGLPASSPGRGCSALTLHGPEGPLRIG